MRGGLFAGAAKLLGLAVATVGLGGCFDRPVDHVAEMKCTSDKMCPVGYQCVPVGQAYGCQRLSSGDGGRDLAGLSDARPGVDGPTVFPDAVAVKLDLAGDTVPPIPVDSALPTDVVTTLPSDTAIVPAPDAGTVDTGPVVIDAPIVSPDLAPDVAIRLDAPIVGKTPTSLGLSAGGVFCSSANYQAILTLGQSPGGNMVMQSANYRMVGGLIGATQ